MLNNLFYLPININVKLKKMHGNKQKYLENETNNVAFKEIKTYLTPYLENKNYTLMINLCHNNVVSLPQMTVTVDCTRQVTGRTVRSTTSATSQPPPLDEDHLQPGV